MREPDLLFWRLAALLGGLGFATLALFVAVPELDIWAAGLFYDGAGFPLRADPVAGALRSLYTWIFSAACVAGALTLAVRLPTPGAGWRTSARPWAFFCALMVVGPGLIANVLFKENWGRARPEAVAAFGGEGRFTPPFALSDACAANCSFVSGEGAAAAALAWALLALFWPALRTAGARALAVAIAAVWLAGAAFIRMGPGKHFLSDTLFAFILTAVAAATLYALFDLRRTRPTPADAAHDVGLAARLLGRAAVASAARLRALVAGGDRPQGGGRP